MPAAVGKVVFGHWLEPLGNGRVRVVKRADVEGGFGPLLRLLASRMAGITQAIGDVCVCVCVCVCVTFFVFLLLISTYC